MFDGNTQIMNDTLWVIKPIYDTIKVYGNTSLDVLSKVDIFYNNAWSKLINIFTFIGLLIPAAFAVYQYQLYRISKRELTDLILAETKEVNDGCKKEIENEMSNVKDELNKQLNMINGKFFQMQGNSSLSKNDFYEAFADYVKAAEYHLAGGDEANLIGAISCLRNEIIPNLSFKQYEEIKEIKKADIDTLISDLDINETLTPIFKKEIRELLKAINNLKEKKNN